MSFPLTQLPYESRAISGRGCLQGMTWFLVLCGLTIATGTSANEPRLSASDQPEALTAEQCLISELDGTIHAGQLQSLNSRLLTWLPANDPTTPHTLSTTEVLKLQFNAQHHSSRRSTPRTMVLEFASGDRLTVEALFSDGDLLSIQRKGEEAWSVPLESLRGLLLPAAANNPDLLSTLQRSAGSEDLLFLTNGDTLAGQLISLDEQTVHFQLAGGETRIARERLAGIAFSPELVVANRLTSPAQIVLTDRGWLTVKDLSFGDRRWTARTQFDSEVHWPAAAVRAIWLQGPRVDFLSDLTPGEAEYTPYFSRVWRIKLDRDVTGQPLMLQGQPVPRGLGLHSRSRVTYQLNEQYETLTGTVTFAPTASDIGNVDLTIEVDRQPKARQQLDAADRNLTSWSLPHLDLRTAKTLTLLVDFGSGGDVLDRVNWCEMALIRKRDQVNPPDDASK